MKLEAFPAEVRDALLPQPRQGLIYRCLGCHELFGIERLLYTCPACGQVLLIEDLQAERLTHTSGARWRQIFDYRRMLNVPALRGIYLFHEFLGPVVPLEAVVYLGEGHTPVVEANADLQRQAGVRFFFKNDGQNPSGSFKDRGMASALSYIRFLLQCGAFSNVLAVCASTGDTSAAAALYAAYLQPQIKSAVLLPHGKVTPQQLGQPLGSGAAVFEIPGVFDDCMKVVEALSERYPVALLNSKNAWRILGQESYSYEIAQQFDYELSRHVIVVPIGNAGNITAVLNGFVKFFTAGIITDLPKIIGVQSHHANPVCRYYREPDPAHRRFVPVHVKPSVAQAAMIGNPVSMPRVIELVDRYEQLAGAPRIHFEEVDEQSIMDWQLRANRNGHIACTHGGECLAGLAAARRRGIVSADEVAVVDSTAHALKFSGFQELYFADAFPSGYGIQANPTMVNAPTLVNPPPGIDTPTADTPLQGDALQRFIDATVLEIARRLSLS
jgi:threonine synthase